MTCDITQIPAIMDGRGWTIAPILMREWFSAAPNADPANGTTDTTTVEMSWALKFKRAKTVHDKMVAEQIWLNKAARQEIARMLSRGGYLRVIKAKLGGLDRPVPEVDQEHIQERAVGALNDPVDDMYGALGFFVFRMAIGGHVKPIKATVAAARSAVEAAKYKVATTLPSREVKSHTVGQGETLWDIAKYYDVSVKELKDANPFLTKKGRKPNLIHRGETLAIPEKKTKAGKVCQSCDPPNVIYYELTIEQVGIYIRDSYDFNGFQILGPWEIRDHAPRTCVVTNGDFRDWRQANGRGGDFLLFSDIELTTRADKLLLYPPSLGIVEKK